jgi:hypothetical protein
MSPKRCLAFIWVGHSADYPGTEEHEEQVDGYGGQDTVCKMVVVESVNGFLKNICQVEHTRHRSFVNFLVNLVGLYQHTASCHISCPFTASVMGRPC